MKVLMVGVDKTSKGGMLTVVENYLNNENFCKQVNLYYVSTVIRAGKIKKLITFIKKIPQIKQIIQTEKIDIVHVHMAERGSVFREGYVVGMANRMGCKTVIHMHGATIEEWYNHRAGIVKKMIKTIFCSADRMLVLGTNLIPFMQSVMSDVKKIRVLHNAVNIPEINLYNCESTDLLFYGMLISRKGIDDLLTAFKNILPRIPENVGISLYGDDYDSDEKIQEKIKRYELGSRVVYKGWLTVENREEAYKNAIANVLPSYHEGLPMTILETMGYGIPNISTDIAAIPEAVISGENGILVGTGDIKALEEAMCLLINDHEIRKKYSDNAYEKAKNEFSLEKHFSKLISIYTEMLK